MTTYTLNVSDVQVFTALQAWLADALTLPLAAIAHEMDNVVPIPQGGFVLMNHVNKHELSTSIQSYNALSQVLSYAKSLDYVLQVDLYGASASDWATIVDTFWRSEEASDFLEPYGFDPLYAEDSLHLEFTNAEAQYEERWTTRLHLALNPVISLSTASMTFAKISPVSVVAAYH